MNSASNENAVFNCSLVDAAMSQPSGQQESLFARSAALQNRQKNLAATLNCERTLVVDFDSSVADNNNTFAGAGNSYHSAMTSGGSLRNDQQRANFKSKFGSSTSLYGTIPLKGHFTNTSSIARSRLLFAQINAREYQLLQSSQNKSCQDLNNLVCACPINPETHLGAGAQHTFAISEKFCIDDSNQSLSVENTRADVPFLFPKTKTCISGVECIRQESVTQYFKNTSCKDLICSNLHLRFETGEPHNFVPGIKFTLLNANNLKRADEIDHDPESTSTYEACKDLETILQGETSAFEVYDVLSQNMFLAVPFRRPVFQNGLLCEQFVGSQSCITAAMFRRKAFHYVSRDELSCANRGDPAHFYGRHQISKCNCCAAFAYICCPTSPQQLECYANQLIESSLYSGIEIHVKGVTYNALQDEFTVKFQSHPDAEPILRHTKNLLGSSNQYSSVSLSRNAMLAVANCPEAKENYLNRALRGGNFFDIITGCNDRLKLFIFVKSCSQIRHFEIVIPQGVYKPNELVECLGDALNMAVECEKECFQFIVEFTLHPTDGLLAWQQSSSKNGYPTLGNSPYESQTFGIIIRNTIPGHRFAVDFSDGLLASTLDFEARKTDFALAHSSRALNGVFGNKCVEKKTCPPCKTSCMRSLYTSKIDRCNGLVTIEQRGLNPLFCNTLDAFLMFSRSAACCEDGPENSIDEGDQGCKPVSHPIDEPCAILLNDCCKPIECEKCDEKCDSDSDSENSSHCDSNGCGPCKKKNDCEPNSAFIVLQLDAFDGSILPVCKGDVIWITFCSRTIAACVDLVSRDCKKSPCSTGIKYKLALGHGGRALYNQLRGTQETSSELPSYLPVKITVEPIGFNLHMNSASTQTKAATENALVPVKPSTQNAISKWLGFHNTTTLSNQKFYTSNSCIQSLLDERLILVVPEINDYARAQPRYGVFSPADETLSRHYGVLTLDRPSGVYKYDNSSDSLFGFASMDRCSVDPCNSVGCGLNASNSRVQHLSFHLLRSDGSAYVSCGDALVSSVEICYSN